MPRQQSVKTLCFRAILTALVEEDRRALRVNEWASSHGLKRTPLLGGLLRIVILMRRAVRGLLVRIPGLAYHKMVADLGIASEIFSILDDLGVDGFLVGGVAYEAKLLGGRGCWYHADIDIAVLDPEMAALRRRLVEAGYEFSSSGMTVKLRKAVTNIDMFVWKEKNGFIQNRTCTASVCMPRSFFRHDIVDLCGAQRKVASDGYIASIAPMVASPRFRRCVEAIAARAGSAKT